MPLNAFTYWWLQIIKNCTKVGKKGSLLQEQKVSAAKLEILELVAMSPAFCYSQYFSTAPFMVGIYLKNIRDTHSFYV